MRDRKQEARAPQAKGDRKPKQIKTLIASQRRRDSREEWRGHLFHSLNRLLLASAVGLLAIGAAQAADLPTKKTPPAVAKPNCFASFWSWLNSTAADCPLSLYGIHFYGQVDVGGGYETTASRFNKDYPQGVQELVNKTSNGGGWQLVPTASASPMSASRSKSRSSRTGLLSATSISASIPIRCNSPTARARWSTTTTRARQPDLERLEPLHGLGQHPRLPRRQQPHLRHVDRRPPVCVQQRPGQQLRPVRRHLRVLADRQLVDIRRRHRRHRDRALQHLGQVSGGLQRFPRRRLTQIGGWNEGNGAQSAYQFDLGGDYAGFSVDAIYAYAKDAVKLSTYNGATPTLDPYDTLKALSPNVNAGVIAAKYKWNALTLYGGYEYARLSIPATPDGATAAAVGAEQ